MATTGGDHQNRVTCPRCHAAVGPGLLLFTPLESQCDNCGSQLEVSFFPALFSAPAPTVAGNLVSAEEAACFYHQAKQASDLCNHCGRFLCSLCSIDWHGEHLCADCIQHAGTQGRRRSDIATRTRYDIVTLALAILPMIIILATLVTAPVTLFLTVYFWKRPCGFVDKRRLSRTCFIIAAIFALLQMIGWSCIIYLAATGALS